MKKTIYIMRFTADVDPDFVACFSSLKKCAKKIVELLREWESVEVDFDELYAEMKHKENEGYTWLLQDYYDIHVQPCILDYIEI